MDEEEEYCCWCGEYIYPDEDPCRVAVYDGEWLIGYGPVCYDCWDSWNI